MNTIAKSSPMSLRSGAVSAPATSKAPATVRPAEGARGLSVLLLAAMVAAMVVLADRLVSTWADGHLLLAWVFLWVVVFAGMALFADAARGLAARAMRSLDGWSEVLAQARADARLWTMAQSDPRLMQELQQAVMRSREESDAPAADFSVALAPLGMTPDTIAAAPATSRWDAYLERLAAQRGRRVPAYYI